MKNFLMDLEFLRKLDLEKNKATYAKIILLTNDELPVYEIQGKITSGSISIDGASAVRRTCSLTMVAPDVDITNTYWALKNKFKLEVGVENTIDLSYPDICWFKQGIYVFTSLNMNVQSNNFSIGINGKDKGCLINGEIGGSINASTDFGKLEEYQTLDNGEIIRNVIDIPIVDIIKNAVHVYAGEPLHNIVINNVDEYGLELLEYRGDQSLYLPRRIDTGEVTNMVINKEQPYYDEMGESIEIGKIEHYYNRVELDLNGNRIEPTIVYDSPNIEIRKAYNIIEIQSGDTAGYRRTELVYPGDLKANVGEALTSVLDKIKNMFSDFEYFYDVDGRFVFQKKKTYMNTSWNSLTKDEDETYAADAAYTSSITYTFEEGVLLTAFTDAPVITNIRNDFSIWGKRTSASGAELPVHMRYAIDFKPEYYFPIRFDENNNQILPDLNSEIPPEEAFYSYDYADYKIISLTYSDFEPGKYFTKTKNGRYQLAYEYNDKETYYEGSSWTGPRYDWRELIYQMALDYFKYNHTKDNFTQLVANANPNYYPTGITGYEEYYTDMQGFWRQLYHPGIGNIDFITSSERKELAREYWLDLKNSKNKVLYNFTKADDLDTYLKGKTPITIEEEVYAQAGQIIGLTQEDNDTTVIYYLLPKLENEDEEGFRKIDVTTSITEELVDSIINLHIQDLQAILREEYNSDYWHKNVTKAPEVLNFWFDFMDTNGEMGKYAVSAIGNRPKAINDDKVKAIYFEQTPTVLFLTEDEEYSQLDHQGYTFIRLTPQMENYFSISAQGKSAQDALDNLLYQHTYATETVTLTAVPIYYLQPNTRIFVKDKNTGINGEFIVSKITVPLQYNGTTSITTTKAVERIY